MEISITRNYQKVFNLNTSNILSNLTRSNKNKILTKCAIPLSFFNLDLLRQGKLATTPFLKDIFNTSFFGFDFSIGALMTVMFIGTLLVTIAPHIGEFLADKDIPSWAYTIVCVVILIGWCFL